jgi:hypothetical protein
MAAHTARIEHWRFGDALAVFIEPDGHLVAETESLRADGDSEQLDLVPPREVFT